MTEQTELVLSKWEYTPPQSAIADEEKIVSTLSLNVMKKRAPTKKGIACRFGCRFVFENEPILEYVAEDSYVIDFEDVIDSNELLNMIMNSYSKFAEKFDFRKLGTVLQNRSITSLDRNSIDVEPILPLLK
ncbi:hypothetical protein [Ferruginibacter sp.]|nr:hypothetical protein [Ferruginibacter sp.]